MCQTFVISLKHFSRAQRSVSKNTDCHRVSQEGPESSLLNVHGNVSWSGWGLSLRVQELCGQYKHGLKGWRILLTFPMSRYLYTSEYTQVNQIKIIDVSHTCRCNICKYSIINTIEHRFSPRTPLFFCAVLFRNCPCRNAAST